MSVLIKGLSLAALFAVAAAIYALVNAVPFSGTYEALLLWVASIACIGFLVGGVFAFDPRSEFKIASSALGRTAFGIAAGLALAALWRWPREAFALSGLVGGALGYFGMLWAKHVDLL
jgi:hypothetical protein